MQEWVQAELETAALGDVRLDARLVRVTELLSELPGESIPEACPSWADTEGAYRLWRNPRVTPERIYAPHLRCTGARAGLQQRVLVIQDGSTLDFTSRRATTGLGYLGRTTRGLCLHPSLVVSDTGLPLGLADMQVWERPLSELGKASAKGRQDKPFIEKESYVWKLAWENVQRRLPTGVRLLGIADQEADMFDLFATPRRPGADLLVRATGDRRVQHPAKQLDRAMRSFPAAGTLTLDVPQRPDQMPRTARLTVRFAPLTLLRSKHAEAELPELPVSVVLVEEETPPKGVKPLVWLLVTTQPVPTYAEALQVVADYKRRWLVEQYFYVLKQGCQVEKLQLESAEALECALACYAVVAWRQLLVTLDARQDPRGSADEFLAAHEWQALWAYHHPGRKLPKQPPTKHEAVRLVARLGGFLARKGDGEPGVKTVWRGFAHLHHLAEGYRLALQNPARRRASAF
jgi:hypothetical protein